MISLDMGLVGQNMASEKWKGNLSDLKHKFFVGGGSVLLIMAF